MPAVPLRTTGAQRLDAQCLPKRSSGPVSWHLEKLLRNGEFSVGESENIHRKNPEPDSVAMVRMNSRRGLS